MQTQDGIARFAQAQEKTIAWQGVTCEGDSPASNGGRGLKHSGAGVRLRHGYATLTKLLVAVEDFEFKNEGTSLVAVRKKTKNEPR